MKANRLAFSPEAEARLLALYRTIADAASPAIARRFTDALVARWESLAQMPLIGRPRPDIRPNLRLMSYRRRAMIAYAVEAGLVTIIGVFYGGQDFETLLRQDDPDD